MTRTRVEFEENRAQNFHAIDASHRFRGSVQNCVQYKLCMCVYVYLSHDQIPTRRDSQFISILQYLNRVSEAFDKKSVKYFICKKLD